MLLRLDPSVPLVWRHPHSLQFGVDRPTVVLDPVTGAEERMLAALSSGVSRTALAAVARAAGVASAEAERLLRRLGRAVVPLEPDASRPERSVIVAGVGDTADRLGDALHSAGIATTMAGDDPERAVQSTDLAVVIAHHVVPPEFYGRWLRRDQPHLPVVITDSGARVGPVIEPGTGPCLYCLERYRTDADPAWPAIAAQLWGRRSPHDRGLVAGEVAAIAARMTLTRVRSGMPGPAASVRLDAATGIRTTRAWAPHPDCACRALGGNGRATAAPTGSARSPTTTARAASGRG